jgi:hypothetical protein
MRVDSDRVAAEQIVGRERRGRVSQLTWCGEGALNRAAASTQTLYVLANDRTNVSRRIRRDAAASRC